MFLIVNVSFVKTKSNHVNGTPHWWQYANSHSKRGKNTKLNKNFIRRYRVVVYICNGNRIWQNNCHIVPNIS